MNSRLKEVFQNIIKDLASNPDITCAMMGNKVMAKGDGVFLKEIYNSVANTQRTAGEMLYNGMSFETSSRTLGRLLLDLTDESASIARKILTSEQGEQKPDLWKGQGRFFSLNSKTPDNKSWPLLSLN